MLGLGNTLGRQSTPLSSAPVGFDKTWNFDSDVEGWLASNMMHSFLPAFKPSNAEEKAGILRAQDTTTGNFPIVYVDLSGFTESGYDNTQPLYYRVEYSVVSSTSIVSIHSVIYGTGGSFTSHTDEATPDQWNIAEGKLDFSGGNDLFQIRFQTNPTTDTGDYAYINYVRVSHTDFR